MSEAYFPEVNRARKIAFVGTSSIGKTTLVEQLRERHAGNPSVAFVPEAARIFFTQNPDVGDRFSALTQGMVQDLQYDLEREAHNSVATVIFCDRSVLDAAVYTRSTGDIAGSDALLEKVAGWLPTYNKVLLLDPADVSYEKDDIRQEEEEVRQGIHQAFLDFFEEKGIPFELLSGTVGQRLTRIEEILQDN